MKVVLECLYIVLCGVIVDESIDFSYGGYLMCFEVVMNDDLNVFEVFLVLFDVVCEFNC